MRLAVLAFVILCAPALAFESIKDSEHINFSDFKDMKPQAGRQSVWFTIYSEYYVNGFRPVPVPLFIETDLDSISGIAVFDVHSEAQRCGPMMPSVLSKAIYDAPSPSKNVVVFIQIPCIYNETIKLRLVTKSGNVFHNKTLELERKHLAHIFKDMAGAYRDTPISMHGDRS